VLFPRSLKGLASPSSILSETWFSFKYVIKGHKLYAEFKNIIASVKMAPKKVTIKKPSTWDLP
jgi:hypothetical protein